MSERVSVRAQRAPQRLAAAHRCFAVVMGTLLCAMLKTVAAQAAAPRVAVVCDAARSPLVEQILGELGFLGFEAVMVDASAGAVESSSLVQLARARGATSAVFVDVDSRRLRLWFARGPLTAATKTPPVVSGLDDRELALRAAEMVRARYALQQVVAEFDDYTRVARLALRVASGPTLSAGGLSPMAHIWLGIGYRPLRWLEIESVVAGPVYPGQISEPEGRGSVFAGLLGIGPLLQLLPRARRVELFIGAGVALGLIHMQGDAVEPFSGQNDWLASGVGYGRLALSVRLTRRLRLRVDGTAGVAVPRPVVTFDGRQVAAWGRPLVSLTAGLEVRP